MELQYLGTAAAEGWPALFCRCKLCLHARKLGGRDIRSRSQALLDGKLLIDFPPDTYYHYLTNPDFDLPAIQHLIVTHSHHDHFAPADLEMHCAPYCDDSAPALNVYGNNAVEAAYRAVEAREPHLKERVAFHRIEPFTHFNAGGYTVTPLRALHDRRETCLIYLISDGTSALLYGHDTGVFPDDTWEYLRGRRLNLVSLDCTSQSQPDGNNHMGLIDAASVRQRLLDEKIADEATVFMVNHFSHNGGWDYDTITREAAALGMLAAWDGMRVSTKK